LKNAVDKKQSIYVELTKLLFLAALIAGGIFILLNVGGRHILDNYFDQNTFIETQNKKKMEKLQNYVTENNLKSNDSNILEKWVRKNNLVSLQIFQDNRLQYDSNYETNGEEWEVSPEDYYEWESYYPITFADGEADVFTIISISKYYNYAVLFEVIISFFVFLFIVMAGIQRTMKYIRRLRNEIEILEGGELNYPITINGKDELTELARGLNEMRISFQEQLEQETYLTQSHKKLVTEMSHDLRTPLTSLLIYTELLKQNDCNDKELQKKYANKIDQKAHLIKKISDNIFEYSLVSSRMEIELEEAQYVKVIFYDLLSEFAGYLEEQGFSVACNLNWKKEKIRINADYLTRIMDNITSNILKYADKNADIIIKSVSAEKFVGISIKNEIAKEDRGEASTNIGLHNIKNMMEGMGGKSRITKDEHTFQIELLFGFSG
jgi:signal transduction histidine kinase